VEGNLSLILPARFFKYSVSDICTLNAREYGTTPNSELSLGGLLRPVLDHMKASLANIVNRAGYGR